jgi:integrase
MVFTFKLRQGKKSATIIAELRLGSKLRIRQSTSFSIPITSIKYWDSKIQLIKVPNDILDSDHINIQLNKIRTLVYSELPNISENKNAGEIKRRIQEIVNPKPAIKDVTEKILDKSYVLNYFSHYIQFYSSNVSPNTGSILSPQTLKTYNNTRVYLKRYLESKKIKDFKFEAINKSFYYDFINYGQRMGYSKNYIGSHLQKLKTIIQAAYDEDIHDNREFMKRYFKKFREEVNHPYLTEEELSRLSQLEIGCHKLDNIRDVFLIACNTGLRIGDLMKFLKNPTTEKINNKTHIYIKQNKTNKPVYIPVNSSISAILEKRNGKFPDYVHKTIVNREIKGLLRRCGVTELVTVEKTIGGKTELLNKPKYQFISCHSARRSFCTNAYNSGVPLQDIMVFSGHSSEKMVLLYIKASAKEKVRRVANHPFFS